MTRNINDSIVNFDKKGCAVSCHLGEGKPYGNKYVAKEGRLGDISGSVRQQQVQVGG